MKFNHSTGLAVKDRKSIRVDGVRLQFDEMSCELLLKWNDLHQKCVLSQENKEMTMQLEELRNQLLEQNLLNKMTKLPKKELFHHILQYGLNHVKGHDGFLCLLLVGLKDFSHLKRVYGDANAAKTLRIFAEALKEAFNGTTGLIVQRSDNVFGVLNLRGSYSWIFTYLDDLNKSLSGLTIPYPEKGCCSEVKAVSGAVFLGSKSAPLTLEVLVNMADEVYEWGKLLGTVRILSL